jgi:pimeloyl-ACP methyl ester carboxylesterase
VAFVDTPAVQVVFLTGQSDAPRCALSPVQRAFLEALPLPASARLPFNFPYQANTAPWRNVSLLAASINNGRQYLASRHPDFAARHAPHVMRQLSRAERTLILAGSAGLELLANLRLPRETLDRVQVFAYGPVARQLPDCPCVLVQGRRDWVSRWWFRTVDHRVDCTHLDYLESPEVLALCVQTLRGLQTVAAA